MSDERVAVYAGSFDPPTNGHMWVIAQGARLFDRLIVAVGVNPAKTPFFPTDDRVAMLRECVREHANVCVETLGNLYLVKYAAARGARYVLRGIRSQADYEFEHQMRLVNADIERAVEMVYLMPPREYSEISSSFVRGMVGPEGWSEVVRRYVPAPVFRSLMRSPKASAGASVFVACAKEGE